MILITGGMGFIGLHTARALLDAGHEVLLTQHTRRREPEFLNGDIGHRLAIANLDVTVRTLAFELMARYPISAIIHLAGPRRGRVSLADEFQVYIAGLLNVLDAAEAHGIGRVVLAGAIGVYSNLERGPFREDAPMSYRSQTANEAAKKVWDVLATRYSAETGMDVVSLRIPIVYGPLYASMNNLPSRLCYAAAHRTQPDLANLVVGTALAGDEYDFCYVKDCALALRLVLDTATLQHTVYNVGGGKAVRNGDLAAAVARTTGTAPALLPDGHTPGGRPDPYMDLTQVESEVGYRPAYDVERGVEDYVDWLRSNPE